LGRWNRGVCLGNNSNVSHNYTAAGDYTITLTATKGNQMESATKSVSLKAYKDNYTGSYEVSEDVTGYNCLGGDSSFTRTYDVEIVTHDNGDENIIIEGFMDGAFANLSLDVFSERDLENDTYSNVLSTDGDANDITISDSSGEFDVKDDGSILIKYSVLNLSNWCGFSAEATLSPK
jgi:hypothetical protein